MGKKKCPKCGSELVSNYIPETKHLCIGCTNCEYEKTIY